MLLAKCMTARNRPLTEAIVMRLSISACVALLSCIVAAARDAETAPPVAGSTGQVSALDGGGVEPNDLVDENATQLKELLKHVETLRAFGQVKRSNTVGGQRGGPFEVTSEEPSVLVGFLYTASRHYAGHLTIKAVRPIFRGLIGESMGDWCGRPHGKARRVCAEDGYAVAGIVAKYGNRVDGMRLIYMRVKDGRLNPDDTYRSEWIGGRRGSPETLCAANGHPVIGIYGRKGADLDALGFLQADATPEPGRSLDALMPRLTGKWVVTYTNKTQHTREIHVDRRVNEDNRIVQGYGDILIDFPEAVERITLVGNRLFVEHFNPRSTYPDGIPAVMGVGKKEVVHEKSEFIGDLTSVD